MFSRTTKPIKVIPHHGWFELLKKRFEDVQKQPFAIPDLKIDGNDVMKIKKVPSGSMVGKYLQMLFEEVVEKGLVNERELLLKKMEEMKF